ncbi:MAG: hypothetical protein ACAI38_10050 [Myxococcota bacterium]|nr:hypothetical protein [Myxococcota bacterium]
MSNPPAVNPITRERWGRVTEVRADVLPENLRALDRDGNGYVAISEAKDQFAAVENAGNQALAAQRGPRQRGPADFTGPLGALAVPRDGRGAEFLSKGLRVTPLVATALGVYQGYRDARQALEDGKTTREALVTGATSAAFHLTASTSALVAGVFTGAVASTFSSPVGGFVVGALTAWGVSEEAPRARDSLLRRFY